MTRHVIIIPHGQDDAEFAFVAGIFMFASLMKTVSCGS